MIIRKETKGNKTTAYYKSSNILGSVYDSTNKTLEVTFKRGARYIYEGVENIDYTRFELADSQGKVLDSHIKKYNATKLDAIEPKLIEEDIEKYVELEVTNIVSSVVDRVLSIISSSDTYSSPDILAKIVKECEKGIEMTKRFQ
jgi:hypothetical protein